MHVLLILACDAAFSKTYVIGALQSSMKLAAPATSGLSLFTLTLCTTASQQSLAEWSCSCLLLWWQCLVKKTWSVKSMLMLILSASLVLTLILNVCSCAPSASTFSADPSYGPVGSR